MSFSIEQRYIDEMIRHAREDVPNECCGVLLGKDGRVAHFRRCENAEHSPFRYSVAPRELLEIDKETRERDWDVLAIYHSHTHTEAYPSPTDVRLAAYPEAVYVLVSLQDDEHPAVRAYNIRDGVITELDVVALANEPARE
jgi:proteasome lid subunit RPN8/RPN11